MKGSFGFKSAFNSKNATFLAIQELDAAKQEKWGRIPQESKFLKIKKDTINRIAQKGKDEKVQTARKARKQEAKKQEVLQIIDMLHKTEIGDTDLMTRKNRNT